MTQSTSQSLFYKEVNPLILAGALLVVSCLSMLIAYGRYEGEELKNIWLVSGSFVLCYVILNSILSYNAENINSYWTRGIIGFVGLILLSSVVATKLSGVSIEDAGTYKWLYVVFTICFIIFLVIVRLMRTIIDLAQKQDKRLRNEQ